MEEKRDVLFAVRKVTQYYSSSRNPIPAENYRDVLPGHASSERRSERIWIESQLEDVRTCGYMSVVAGDFNTYPDERIHRQSAGQRDTSARHVSDRFRE
jgi:hypothetical protein